jgi:polar amino acid transport system substrate-binding protein
MANTFAAINSHCKKNTSIFFHLILGCCLLSGCTKKQDNTIYFATCADSPPFEYYSNGELAGFEIDLAKAVAEKLGKIAAFKDMPFGSILAAVQTGSADVGVASICATAEREQNFDFSQSYFTEMISVVSHGELKTQSDMESKKIACQLGSNPEKWLKENIPSAQLTIMDNVCGMIEALKAGHVDGVFVDSIVAQSYCQKNEELNGVVIAKESGKGFAFVFKKGATLRAQVSQIVSELEKSGEMNNIKKKWGLACTD